MNWITKSTLNEIKTFEVKVFFCTDYHCELIAIFIDENIYDSCIDSLEKKAKELNMLLTESINQN